MYYTVYKVTNKISGKFYVGTHKTKHLDDGYMGSGKYLRHAINKHGIENFTKEILFVFDNPESMYDKKAEIVTDDFLAEENTYNLRVGGFGDWDYVNSNTTSEFAIQRAKLGRKATDLALEEKYGEEWRVVLSEIGRKKLKTIMQDDPDYLKKTNVRSFLGKKHKKETIEKMRCAAKERYKRENNPAFGKRWIYSEKEKISKLIPKNKILPIGWKEGRKLTFKGIDKW